MHSATEGSNVNNNRKNQQRNNENTLHSDKICLKPTNHSPKQVNGEYSPKVGKKCDNKVAKSKDKKNNEDIISPGMKHKRQQSFDLVFQKLFEFSFINCLVFFTCRRSILA